MSKGSSPRPFSVSQEEYAKNFDKIFKKKQTADEKFREEFEKQVILKNEYYDLGDTFSDLVDE